MIFGLDGASWQGYPDWAKLHAEWHRFMLWKVTGEGNYVNPTAQANLARAFDAGFVTGGYDWVEPQRSAFLPTGEDAANDYLRVLDAIGAWRKGFLLGVDWETPEWATGPLGANVEGYMRRYFGRLYDVAMAKRMDNIDIYTAPYFLEETGGKHWDWLARYRLWVAAPGPQAQLPDDTAWPEGVWLAPWDRATLHQHQWHATSVGVSGEFDRDRFDGDERQLWALGYQGVPNPEPEVYDMLVPPEGKWSVEVLPNGNTAMILNFGGQTYPDGILGAAIVDVGVTVKSMTEEGVSVSRSFQNEEAKNWVEQRPAGGG